MRLSYSSAAAWWAGDVDKAIKMILHEDTALPIRFESELKRERAMAFGHGAHKMWELESKVTGYLPAIFKIPDFTVIATELKMTKELPTGDTLSGVVDAVAINTDIPMILLVDYKTGTSFNDRQADVYHYLAHDNPEWLEEVGDFLPTHFMFLCLNKKTEQVENTIIQLTYPKNQEEWELPEATTFTRGANWICTVAEDIQADEMAMAKLGQVI